MDIVFSITVQLHEQYEYSSMSQGIAALDVTVPLEVLDYLDCVGIANNLKEVAKTRFLEALKEEEGGEDD